MTGVIKPSRLFVESKSASFSTTANTNFSAEVDITKSGYLIMGIVGWTCSPRSKLNVTSVDFSNGTGKATTGGYAYETGNYTFSVAVLYMKL